MINFQQTSNETVLPTAAKILNESITHSQNDSRLGDLQIDPSSVVVAGDKFKKTHYFVQGKTVSVSFFLAS